MKTGRKVAGRRWQGWLLALVLAAQVALPIGVAAADSIPPSDSRPVPATAAPENECEDLRCG